MDAKILLFEYIQNGNIKDAYMLLREKLVGKNATNLPGYTPLHYAVLCNRESMVDMILQFNVDINMRNNYECGHSTALITAVKNQNPFLVKMLLEKGADANYADKQGLTPLHHAAASGHQEIVRLLVESSADLNRRDVFGFNAYYHANQNNHLENNKELAMMLGKELKVTTSDVRAYREDFKRVHVIVDRRKKPRVLRSRK